MRPTTRTLAPLGLLALALAPAVAGAAPSPFPPSGLRVDLDPGSGMLANRAVGVSDVVGGALVAGARPVPWAAFEKRTPRGLEIFVRAFDGTRWVTKGSPASLNVDPTVDAEAPSIDFAGPGRTVPWTAWYEPLEAIGDETQIVASHFDATTNRWIAAGQDRGLGAPSININTGREAENPAVAGGATTAGNPPAPWIAWQEKDGPGDGKDQIFVSRAVKTATPACAPGTLPAGGNVIGGFCWQEVGIARVSPTDLTPATAVDASLNIDPTRDAIEPDIAFTGPNDTVPWVVWYEEGPSALGLRTNSMVFAAKGVADPTAIGGFRWVAEGRGTTGGAFPLDRSGANGVGPCGASAAAEAACSLNADPTRGAVDARVAAGTLTPGGTTVPWVVFTQRLPSGKAGIFVSRLVGGDRFELVNGGAPLSPATQDAGEPDITFVAHTPVITWTARVGGARRGFVGHLTPAGTFVLDTPNGIQRTRAGLAPGLRMPVSSDCTADPTSADGSACRGGGAGAAFFLFADGKRPDGVALFSERLGLAGNSAPAIALGGVPARLPASGRVTVRTSEPGVVTVSLRRGTRTLRQVTVDAIVAGKVAVVLPRLGRLAAGRATLVVRVRDELGLTAQRTKRVRVR